MPRVGRLDVLGSIYHVFNRGINRRKIFRNDLDRRVFLKYLSEVLEKTGCRCYAWALMPNHFHLLVRPLKVPLSSTMRRLMTRYVLYFNAHHRRVGHLFQNRYKSILCQEDSYFLELVRYIHLNPLRSRLVNNPQELDQYPWTGHAALVGNNENEFQNLEEVYSRFGKRRNFARKKYREFVISEWNTAERKDFSGGGLLRSAGGMQELKRLKKMNQKWKSDCRILGDGDFVSSILSNAEKEWENAYKLQGQGWDLKKLARRVSLEFKMDEKVLVSGRRLRRMSLPKGVFVYLGNEYLGTGYAEIARFLNMGSDASAYKLRERGERYVREKGNILIRK